MLTASYTDKELVAKLTAGDAASFHYLYQQYAATFYAIIVKNVIKPGVAADLLEQFFFCVPQQLHSYNASTQRFFVWMLHLLKSDVLAPYFAGHKGIAEEILVREHDSSSTRKQRSASELSTFYKLSPTQIQSIMPYQ